ncbi:hypothetical protein CEXT_553881 [Caerostris extrusa]|uniref:Uncharacterized protein n=1 Tax=Caerostris extrusa TaxID=172846 RepID=A0AAV4NL60_CAEEX|nr:hypothetical protein CEXT_553881 [Caerostris extrusa]
MISTSVYVDDLLLGSLTVEGALKLDKELFDTFQKLTCRYINSKAILLRIKRTPQFQHWVKSLLRAGKPFVSNRIVEIQNLTNPKDWSHCRKRDNAADSFIRIVTKMTTYGGLSHPGSLSPKKYSLRKRKSRPM